MRRFIPFYCRGDSKPAALLEGKWGCVFPFSSCQHVKMLCLDSIVPATAQTEQKTALTGKQTARQEAAATLIPQRKSARQPAGWDAGLTISLFALVPKKGCEGRLGRGEMR